MKCDICKKRDAVFHMQEQSAYGVRKISLCIECALTKGLNIRSEDVDKLFEIISKAEEDIEKVKRAFDYKAKISGSAEKMYNDIIAIQKKMKIDFDEEFKKIYKAKMKKQ